MIEDDLEPLITQCPSCSTRFRVTEAQLSAAAGRVRCGACLTVFEGADHLLMDEQTRFNTGSEADAALDELLSELSEDDPDPTEATKTHTPQLSADEAEPEIREGSLVSFPDGLDVPTQIYGGFEEGEESDEAPEPVEAVGGVEEDDAGSGRIEGTIEVDEQVFEYLDEPEFEERSDDLSETIDDPELALVADSAEVDEVKEVEEVEEVDSVDGVQEDELTGLPRPPSDELLEAPDARPDISFAPEPRRWWMGVVSGVFLVALAVQIFYFQFPVWSRDPGLRPIYELACGWLSCELPRMRDLRQMSTRNLVVRSHPDLDAVLIVDAVIVNDAAFEQAFPDLELRFTAVSGQLVAGRLFEPGEYLAKDSDAGGQMPSNTPIQVSLEIRDPGPDAVNYTLTFR